MRSIGLFGLTLLTIFALGAVVASTASATEPGLLFLPGEEGPVSISGKTGVAVLKSAGKALECKKSTILSAASEAGTHVTLFKDVDLHFSECKKEKLNCNTEGDSTGIILLLVDLHMVNLLEGEVLRPGVGVIILNPKLELLPIAMKCGVGLIELKGVVFGLVLASLTSDISSAAIDFPTALPCDTTDTLCKELAAKPFEANFTGKFELAEEKSAAEVEFSKMVVLDD